MYIDGVACDLGSGALLPKPYHVVVGGHNPDASPAQIIRLYEVHYRTDDF